jgi:beta-mannosidase
MSEYGVQSWPSYSTLADVYSMPDDAIYSGELNMHRQHHENGNQQIIDQIENNFPLPTNLHDDHKYFKAIIYLSQVNQAMTLKTGTELFRRYKNKIDPLTGHGNTMGSMYWQLNDVWQAPTWSSIEYMSSNGVNTGGKWKLAHYYIKNSYSAIILSPEITDTELIIFAVSDLNYTLESSFNLKFYSFEDGFHEKKSNYYNFTIEPFTSKPVFVINKNDEFIFDCESSPLTQCFIQIESADRIVQNGAQNFLFIGNGKLNVEKLKVSNINYEVLMQPELNNFESNLIFTIRLKADDLALFVNLDMNTTRFYGAFSDNGFHITEPLRTVFYTTPNLNVNLDDIKNSLNINSLADFYL